jgi:predicted DNA-binding protein
MAKNAAPSDQADRFLLRLPPGMRERIAEIAKESGRSMNAEIIARLERSLEADSDFELMKDLVAEHENRLEEIEKAFKRLGRNVDIVAERVGIDT